jgi:hypothetical protein
VLLVLHGRVVGLATVNGFPRVWVEEADHIFNEVRLPGREERSTWRGKVALEALPDEAELRLDLYAVDSERMRVHPLPERVVVRRAPGARPQAFVEERAP